MEETTGSSFLEYCFDVINKCFMEEENNNALARRALLFVSMLDETEEYNDISRYFESFFEQFKLTNSQIEECLQDSKKTYL